MPSIASSCHG
uniref:Uncharacterized protein n=1 Tax=Arundo donax TaxID=35708 RepID=A0A0A9H0F8_ARUDO